MAFKKQKISESEFIAQARGETDLETSESKKLLTCKIDVATIKRLDKYSKSEGVRKSFVINEAVNMWLDSKGFEK